MLRCVLLSWWEIDCNLNLHGSPTTTSINHKCGRKNYLMDGKFGELKVWEYCESGGRVAVLVGSFIMITSAGSSGARTHTLSGARSRPDCAPSILSFVLVPVSFTGHFHFTHIIVEKSLWVVTDLIQQFSLEWLFDLCCYNYLLSTIGHNPFSADQIW